MPFRQASETVDLATPITVSHTTIHTMTQEIGQQINDYTAHRPGLKDSTKRKQVPVLFIEGDGLVLKSRGDGPVTLHRVITHEGVNTKKKRSNLINPFCFVSTASSSEAFKQLAHYLDENYQFRDTVVISNSDGGSGYEADKFEIAIGYCRQHEHFRDRYHVNRKVKERLAFD